MKFRNVRSFHYLAYLNLFQALTHFIVVPLWLLYIFMWNALI